MQSLLFEIDVWAYCLMDNHVRLIVVPRKNGSMTKAIGEMHRLYTRMINFREGWRGYLWQGRFKSFVMDEKYLIEGMRYVEMNPVRANMVRKAEDYRYSNAGAHVKKVPDEVLSKCYLEKKIKSWSGYLAEGSTDEMLEEIRKRELTGRPLGDESFIEKIERLSGRQLIPKKPGLGKNK